MKQGALLGRILQETYPGIEQDYRDGKSKPELVRDYEIKENHGVGQNVALKAIDCALRGHPEESGVKAYEGLIKDGQELKRLGRATQGRSSRVLTKEERIANGKKAYNLGVGIHSYTPKQRRQHSQKGGIIARDQRLGFHGFTEEQKKANQLKASVASGNILWTDMQKQRVHELAKDKNYRWASKGPNYAKIAQQINIEFHNGKTIRNRSSINYVLFKCPVVASA